MTLRSLIFPMMFATCSLFACSSDDPSSSDTTDAGDEQNPGSDAHTTQNEWSCDDSESTDLTGTWALLARYSIALHGQSGGMANLCPMEQVDSASLLAVVDIAKSGDGYTMSAVSCHLALPSVKAMAGKCEPDTGNYLTVNIDIPAPMYQSFATLDPVHANGTLSPSSALSFDPFRFTWGTRANTLPSWQPSQCGDNSDKGHTSECETTCVTGCDDLVDDDNDGFPGVTVHLCGRTEQDRQLSLPCNAVEPNVPGITFQGSIPMALYSQLTLQGNARSSCEASGTFSSDTQYKVLGSDVWISGTSLAVSQVVLSLLLFEGQAADSRWRLVRVDGTHGSPNWNLPQDAPGRCAKIRANENELK